jgi:CheY-like chemotaxis protein
MRILIAEDDLDISTLYKKASNCSEVRKRDTFPFSAIPPYDVVILDYKMPGMNGMDVAKEILAINPHQRIIFASAYVKETLQEGIIKLCQPPLADYSNDMRIYCVNGIY